MLRDFINGTPKLRSLLETNIFGKFLSTIGWTTHPRWALSKALPTVAVLHLACEAEQVFHVAAKFIRTILLFVMWSYIPLLPSAALNIVLWYKWFSVGAVSPKSNDAGSISGAFTQADFLAHTSQCTDTEMSEMLRGIATMIKLQSWNIPRADRVDMHPLSTIWIENRRAASCPQGLPPIIFFIVGVFGEILQQRVYDGSTSTLNHWEETKCLRAHLRLCVADWSTV